jgi:hypothetical protein
MADVSGDDGAPTATVTDEPAVPAPPAASPKPEAAQQAAPAATPSDAAGWEDSSEEDEPLAKRKTAKQGGLAAL